MFLGHFDRKPFVSGDAFRKSGISQLARVTRTEPAVGRKSEACCAGFGLSAQRGALTRVLSTGFPLPAFAGSSFAGMTLES